MKSKNVLVVLALVFLILAITVSLTIWSDVSMAAKIAFFAFGYGAGVTTGARMTSRQSSNPK